MGHPQLAWFHPRLLVARHADAATGAPLLTELALRRCRAPPPSTLNVILEGAEPVSPTTHVHLADFAGVACLRAAHDAFHLAALRPRSLHVLVQVRVVEGGLLLRCLRCMVKLLGDADAASDDEVAEVPDTDVKGGRHIWRV